MKDRKSYEALDAISIICAEYKRDMDTPAVGSKEWAWEQMEQGKCVVNDNWGRNHYIRISNGKAVCTKCGDKWLDWDNGYFTPPNGWQIYTPALPSGLTFTEAFDLLDSGEATEVELESSVCYVKFDGIDYVYYSKDTGKRFNIQTLNQDERLSKDWRVRKQ